MNAAEISILPKWADIFDPCKGEDVPADLIGAKIVAIGAPTGMKEKSEGGGLAIEYIPASTKKKKLILLDFDECGMWLRRD